jgi:adenosylcobinamide-GDP ribazoletransferase
MKAVRSLLQFTTILPLGKLQEFELFARNSYLFPIAGYVTGLLVALPVFFIPDRVVAAAAATAGVILISGAHHFDGLLDFGDGLMANGDREKRVQALTDRYVGAGGIAAGIVVTLLLFSGFFASPSIIAAIIVGEVGAKFSMGFLTAYGPPFKEGIHHYLHGFARPYFPFLSFLACVPLILLPVRAVSLATAAVIMIACPAILLPISKRLFGGVNGDIVGATHEITRAAIVLAIALV